MEALKQVEHLVSAKLAVIKTLLDLVRLEARLAGLSIVPLVLSLCFLLIVLMTVWILASLLIGYGLLLACNSILLSLGIVFIMNLGVLLYLVKSILSNIKNMSFEKTRAYFSQNQDIDYEQLEKADQNTNRDER